MLFIYTLTIYSSVTCAKFHAAGRQCIFIPTILLCSWPFAEYKNKNCYHWYSFFFNFARSFCNYRNTAPFYLSCSEFGSGSGLHGCISFKFCVNENISQNWIINVSLFTYLAVNHFVTHSRAFKLVRT